jgi:hypothetical protein
MPATITRQTSLRELSYREGDGIQVWLLWSPATDEVSVLVTDTRTEESFELDVPPANALEVFEHPFAYAARDEKSLAA